MPWYIDAWSPLDGYAFASEREDGELEIGESHVWSEPPHFEPLPVRDPATALGATARAFQDRFFIDGDEVAFDRLGELIEAVRRAYLGGGRGSFPSPSGDGGGVEPPREPPPSEGEDVPPTDDGDAALAEVAGRSIDDVSDAQLLLALERGLGSARLRARVADVGLAVLELLARSPVPTLDAKIRVADLAFLVAAAVEWSDYRRTADVLRTLAERVQHPDLRWRFEGIIRGWWPPVFADSRGAFAAAILDGALFDLPCPMWGGLSKAKSLGEAMIVAVTNRRGHAVLADYDVLAALHLCGSLVLRAAGLSPTPAGLADWIARAIPRIALPDAIAGEVEGVAEIRESRTRPSSPPRDVHLRP